MLLVDKRALASSNLFSLQNVESLSKLGSNFISVIQLKEICIPVAMFIII